MSALSIRKMNFTLQTMEHIRAEQDTAWYLSLPAEEKAEKSHYWHVQRKAKRGKKWIFVRDLQATKREAAEYFKKYCQPGVHRLHHLLNY